LHGGAAPAAPAAAPGLRLRRARGRRPLSLPARHGPGAWRGVRHLPRPAGARPRGRARSLDRGGSMSLVAQLAALRDAGHLTDLDVHLADLLARLAGGATPELVLAAALVSHRTGEGNVCADLMAAAGRPLVEGAPDAPIAPDLASWTAALRATSVVGAPGDGTPLVLDAAGRLYLGRYWSYEQTLADGLAARAAARPAGVDQARLRAPARTGPPRDPGARRPARPAGP